MKMFEDFAEEKEYFLVIWSEYPGDVAMVIVSMEHYERAVELLPRNKRDDIGAFWNFIEENTIRDANIPLYDTYDNPLVGYNIVKMMNAPNY